MDSTQPCDKEQSVGPQTAQQTDMESPSISTPRPPLNKGRLVGRKKPFKLNEIWAIRVRLQLACRVRKLALFNLGIDRELRACDLVKL